MRGSKLWLCAAVVGLWAGQANAQGYYVPSGYIGFPVVAGPVYSPVPTGVQYAPAYRYVTPAAYSYNVQTITPVVATEAVTTTTTTVASPVVAPVPVVTQTSYYVPTVVTPVVPVVDPYARVRVYPRRGVVRIRY
ncbi:hypothetical protein SH661x_004190 [Planctomicrobium sp. SH661]|uniref:hypothetical protein n=1 Tax=Planctomicrobium sp. SH661 TaxID=3448124 RepID=UPI003F5BE43A